ncbi:MAG: hypothetical protein AB1568_07020 [Thermodesulfobacteriota bacterium]
MHLQPQPIDLRPRRAIDGWPLFHEEGRRYLKTAVNGWQRRSRVFTPEIVYNLVAMGCEKLFMAYLLAHGALPENHTMLDLIGAVETIAGPQPELREELAFMDGFQEICDMDSAIYKVPTAADLERMFRAADTVRAFVGERLPGHDTILQQFVF